MPRPNIINHALIKIRKALNASGFDVYLVGGCVRDLQIGARPKDIDLTTSANPQEQIACYQEAGMRYILTGMQHGTISVVLNGEAYEITSMRTEANHDGRYAEMTYTRDLEEDLSRRDLTINAMAMTFDGKLIDPFGGQEDLRNKVVKFVGNADDRLREDYLRILRLLRFQGRFAGAKRVDEQTAAAIRKNAAGLRNISRERVWMEVAKIISGPSGPLMMSEIKRLGISPYINMPSVDLIALHTASNFTNDPVSLMTAYLGSEEEVDKLSLTWKWSSRERYQALVTARHMNDPIRVKDMKLLAVMENIPLPWLAEIALINGDKATASTLLNWNIPEFPVSGNDLIATGMSPGRDLGVALSSLKKTWAEGGYSLTKGELLDIIKSNKLMT